MILSDFPRILRKSGCISHPTPHDVCRPSPAARPRRAAHLLEQACGRPRLRVALAQHAGQRAVDAALQRCIGHGPVSTRAGEHRVCRYVKDVGGCTRLLRLSDVPSFHACKHSTFIHSTFRTPRTFKLKYSYVSLRIVENIGAYHEKGKSIKITLKIAFRINEFNEILCPLRIV